MINSAALLCPPAHLFTSTSPTYSHSVPPFPFFICFTYLSAEPSSYSPLSCSSAQALCLSDEPRAVKEYRYPEQLPGELYDADTQCKWQFGEKAKLCTLDFKKVN